MKISKIVVESKEEIEVMLALKSKSVAMLQHLVNIELDNYENDLPHSAAKLHDLCELLDSYITDIEDITTVYLPANYDNDPDIDEVLDDFYVLDQYILSVLDSVNN